MLTQAPRFGDIADNLLNQLNGKIIVGHNVSFDLRFLESELNRVNIQLDPRAIAVFDTMSLTSLLGHLPNKKMGTVARAIGVNFDSLDGRGEHDALTDVIAESMVLQRYFKEKADAVWYLVKFPRYKGGFVRFLTRSDHQEMLAKDDAWDVIAKRVKEQEQIELTLAKGSEVYLSSVTWGQISKYEQLLTESGLVLAKSLTKSRTKVVVMGGFDTRSDTLHKADRWGIPVITVENLHLLKVSE
jgi:DNA polymerase-3 subunit epsilon